MSEFSIKVMIELKKIIHRRRPQILMVWSKIDHKRIFNKLSLLPELKYSKTHNGWYLPYTKSNFELIKRTGFEIRYEPKKAGPFQNKKRREESNGHQSDVIHREVSAYDTDISTTSIIFSGGKFIIRLPYVQSEVRKIKSLYRAYWSAESRAWIVAGTLDNLIELQQFFKYWSEEKFVVVRDLIKLQEHPQQMTIYQIPESNRFVAVKLVGYKTDVAFIKSIPGRQYQKNFGRWLIPNERIIVQRVLDHYRSIRTTIVNRLPAEAQNYYKWQRTHGEKQKRLLSKCAPSHLTEIRRYTDVMISQRYSWNTIKNYASSMRRFCHFMDPFTIQKGTAKDVNRYLNSMASKNVSYAELNRHCSAIKFYYEKVRYRSDFEIEQIVRPRSPKILPKILSMKQVKSMFDSVTNIKHLSMLYMLYNGGLRSGELVKLRMQDMQWDRSQVFIQGGKGKKDRVVMLGEVMKGMLQEYVEQYHPQFWLFEGQKPGTPYSSRSLNVVVKRAAKMAGITQKVTTHTLRHCFATHLLESGTSIRLIQELLGHRDIKTTLIYTHVSQENIGSVASPLDALSSPKLTKKT